MYHVHYQAQEMMCCLELANARHLFTFSAQRGYRPSMVKLGLIYYMGRGIEPDILRALHWFVLPQTMVVVPHASITTMYMTFLMCVLYKMLLISNFYAEKFGQFKKQQYFCTR